MSTQLSIIRFVLSPVNWRKGAWGGLGGGGHGNGSDAAIPRRVAGLCTQPVNDISSAGFPLGSASRPDSQTWTSSCEPSVRCVRSQRGGRTPITAALSGCWFPLSPLDHTHACQPPVCRSHWSPHSRLSAVVWFRLGEFKSTNSSGRADTHQWCSCLMSCPDAACLWLCVRKRFRRTGQRFLQTWPEFFWRCHYRQLEHQSPRRSTFHYLWLSR